MKATHLFVLSLTGLAIWFLAKCHQVELGWLYLPVGCFGGFLGGYCLGLLWQRAKDAE